MAGKLKLAATIVILGLIWLVALPYASSRSKMAAHIEWLEQEGVDPSAMYYTELEMMKPIFTRLALERREIQAP